MAVVGNIQRTNANAYKPIVAWWLPNEFGKLPNI